MNITIIIATKNRPNFIYRQLQYYSESNYKGFLFFGDASDDNIFERNAELIKKFEKRLKIKHFHDKESSCEQAYKDLMQHVATKYLTLLPDDDLIITPSIVKCIDFLDINNDYSAAHGKSYEMTINYGKDDAFGKITAITPYQMMHSGEDLAVERIETYIINQNNINMSIIRTDVSIRAIKACDGLDDYYSTFVFGELTHGSVVLSKGKVKELNSTYLIRQLHDNQKFDAMSWLEWFSGPEWCNSFQLLKSTILSNISTKEPGAYEINKKRIESLMSKYIRNLLLSLCKANFLFKIKSITIINKMFRYYRHLKLRKRGVIATSQINDIDVYTDIINRKH